MPELIYALDTILTIIRGGNVPAKRKKPELRIVFDTSAIYTNSEYYLLKKDIADTISEHKSHKDIVLSWYMPEIVRHERQYQILTKSLEILPSIQKLEKLLGHNLNITKEIIIARVNESIDKQIQEHNLIPIKINTSKVNWDNVIINSAYRNPPFESGKTEKGFRDTLVAESFCQLVNDAPVTAKICRIIFLTDDTLLRRAVSEKISGSSNVHILSSTEELIGLINTLASEADETFINSIKEKCAILFFQPEDQDTIYYKEEVGKKIKDIYSSQLKEMPNGCEVRENAKWYVGNPQFVKKIQQRIYWSTRLRVIAKAYVYLKRPDNDTLAGVTSGMGLLNLGGFSGTAAYNPQDNTAASASLGVAGLAQALAGLKSDREKILSSEGESIFSINWSVSVSTTTKRLGKPKVDEIIFVKTVWNQKN